MIDIHGEDVDYLREVLEFAIRNDVAHKLLEKLAFLSNYGNGPGPIFGRDQTGEQLAWALTNANPNGSVCQLYPDSAPHSFTFVMLNKDGSRWFNGGLIYSGPGQRLDGGFPALTVGIGIDDSVHGWSVHT